MMGKQFTGMWTVKKSYSKEKRKRKLLKRPRKENRRYAAAAIFQIDQIITYFSAGAAGIKTWYSSLILILSYCNMELQIIWRSNDADSRKMTIINDHYKTVGVRWLEPRISASQTQRFTN